MLRITWSARAILDMSRIGRHIAADSPAHAAALLDRIEKGVLRLATYPKIGKMGTRPGTRVLVVHAHYLVVYRVLSDSIYILTIKHVARKWPL